MNCLISGALPRTRAARRHVRFLRTARGKAGTAILVVVVVIAVGGPVAAPHAIDQPIGVPGEPMSGSHLLGTDILGRDVLSRLLSGGWSVLSISLLSVLLTYAAAIAVGGLAALSRSRASELSMRVLDLLIVFPPLLLLLVLVAGAGFGTIVMLVGIVVVTFPGAARLVFAATQEMSTNGFVEAATARGERTPTVLVREILPNIVSSLLADGGVRFLSAIFLVAGLNFLGVGAQPPAADWALMIAENRQILQANPAAVLAPAIALALLTIAVNLVGDAYVASLDSSEVEK